MHTTCDHMASRPDGVCSNCGTTTCLAGLSTCLCQVGYPYELQCGECRDRPNRIDSGYCVCVPLNSPPRDVLSANGLGGLRPAPAEAAE